MVKALESGCGSPDQVLRFLTLNLDRELHRARKMDKVRAEQKAPKRAAKGARRSRGRPADGAGGVMMSKKKYYVKRKKVCKFTAEGIEYIDYKDLDLHPPVRPGLRQDPAAPRVGHQPDLPAQADTGVKRARHMALAAHPRGLRRPSGMASARPGRRTGHAAPLSAPARPREGGFAFAARLR